MLLSTSVLFTSSFFSLPLSLTLSLFFSSVFFSMVVQFCQSLLFSSTVSYLSACLFINIDTRIRNGRSIASFKQSHIHTNCSQIIIRLLYLFTIRPHYINDLIRGVIVDDNSSNHSVYAVKKG